MLLVRDDNANWTYNGAEALVEFIEEVEGEDAELDVVALRCEFSQYDSLLDFANEYGMDGIEDYNEDDHGGIDLDEYINNFITDQGILIEFDGGIIVSSF